VIEVFLIILTSMGPHVPLKVQEIKIHTDCEKTIERLTPLFEQTEGLVYHMRCERRKKLNPKEKK